MKKQKIRQVNPFTKALGKRGKELDELFKAGKTPENFEAFGKLMNAVIEEATKDEKKK
jgi:hypothetical protein